MHTKLDAINIFYDYCETTHINCVQYNSYFAFISNKAINKCKQLGCERLE